MGCGASALRPEDHNHLQYKVVRPINGEPLIPAPPPLKNDAVFSFHVRATDHEEVGMKGANIKHGHAKPPSSNNVAAHSDAHHTIDDRDDAITGNASPSFREYCVISRSSTDTEHSHYNPDMVETTDNNMGNDGPMVSKSQSSSRKEITNPKKEGEKKERKGNKLRGVINKGRAGGKKIGIVRHRLDNRAGRLT